MEAGRATTTRDVPPMETLAGELDAIRVDSALRRVRLSVTGHKLDALLRRIVGLRRMRR